MKRDEETEMRMKRRADEDEETVDEDEEMVG